ncbi:MAG: hypothetical protein A2075_21530 [Geobacteraceae bacterium GWC2_58_44]|nr:MAG: hypothetical protein A2075_21530 [Geobacteraceae bacterium GWC2_58_44]
MSTAFELVEDALQSTAALPLKNYEPFRQLELCFQQTGNLASALDQLKRGWSWGGTDLVI